MNKLNMLSNEMRQIEDLYIKKTQEKEQLNNNMIEFKKNQLKMLEEWAQLDLEKQSIIHKLSY